ncbi:hypothetical protein PF005_g25161 [Phytophthora fragariae]|uniref:Uncharacterized protein n=1 Tax=Phytophthora fragariae TaxID=53985 RepID=A0A6A3QG48_9STRA|nr:hypothetical protein PF003_g37898 [Phytophthora fragariae]KAE8923840.1 hypothetical protein PF009_g25917 [Phytophthora fragariae]KAE8978230.1 hypothetical protein PF011_g23334 [Phytophthora fragariae]KAE9074917.1 hypothetical protein PF007_g25212 [Phytophthora fragariae]KAE9076435.1 hypothetical protein PF010_g23902 [Phytophthora fragariae]
MTPYFLLSRSVEILQNPEFVSLAEHGAREPMLLVSRHIARRRNPLELGVGVREAPS